MPPVDVELELNTETVNDGQDEILTLRLGGGEAALVISVDPGASQHRSALLARDSAAGARLVEALAERVGLALEPWDPAGAERILLPLMIGLLTPDLVAEMGGPTLEAGLRLEIQLSGELWCDLDIDPDRGWACFRQLDPDQVGFMALGLRPTPAPTSDAARQRERPPWAPSDTYVLMEHDSGVSLGPWVERTGLSQEDLVCRLDTAGESRLTAHEQRIDAALVQLARGGDDALDRVFRLDLPYAVAHGLSAIGCSDGPAGDDAVERLRERLRGAALRSLLEELQRPAGVESWLGLTHPVSDELVARLRAVAERTAEVPEAGELPVAIGEAAEALAGGELPESTHSTLEARLARVERLVDMGAPTIIIANDLRMLARLLPG